jgi:hypothetical protein
LAALIKAERDQKLHELGHMIRGTSAGLKTKGASSFSFANYSKVNGPLEKKLKLKQLGKMIRS